MKFLHRSTILTDRYPHVLSVIDMDIEENARMGVDYEDLIVPYLENEDFEKNSEMMRKYFPCVMFSDFLDPNRSNDGIYLDLYYKIIEKYKDRDKEKIYNKYYLDIPKMAGDKIFAPLFPSWGFEESINKKGKRIITNKLKKTLRDELEKADNSGERPDIIKFFRGFRLYSGREKV